MFALLDSKLIFITTIRVGAGKSSLLSTISGETLFMSPSQMDKYHDLGRALTKEEMKDIKTTSIESRNFEPPITVAGSICLVQ